MDPTTETHTTRPQRWWKAVSRKPAGEIALDLALFVLGVMVLYAIDLTVISRNAPLAFQYIIDLVLYLNHQAVAAVEMLY
jgi:hypothetical protein